MEEVISVKMFGDDSFFDEIEKAFFNQAKPRRTSYSNNFIQGEQEERVIDYIEEDDFIYLVFELPGYSKEDVNIELKGKELEISAVKKNYEQLKPALAAKLKKGIFFRKTLPSGIKLKNYEETFNNGILEMRFKRK